MGGGGGHGGEDRRGLGVRRRGDLGMGARTTPRGLTQRAARRVVGSTRGG
jgi:hypothetical protein